MQQVFLAVGLFSQNHFQLTCSNQEGLNCSLKNPEVSFKWRYLSLASAVSTGTFLASVERPLLQAIEKSVERDTQAQLSEMNM